MAAVPSVARPLPLGPQQGIAYDVTPCETQQPTSLARAAMQTWPPYTLNGTIKRSSLYIVL